MTSFIFAHLDYCISFFSDAVIKQQEQINLQKKDFMWSCNPRVLERKSKEWGQEQEADNSHFEPQYNTESTN